MDVTTVKIGPTHIKIGPTHIKSGPIKTDVGRNTPRSIHEHPGHVDGSGDHTNVYNIIDSNRPVHENPQPHQGPTGDIKNEDAYMHQYALLEVGSTPQNQDALLMEAVESVRRSTGINQAIGGE